MNVFLRLMHEGLSIPKRDQRTVDVTRELAVGRRKVAAITDRLKTAFPVPEWALKGRRKSLAADTRTAEVMKQRFAAIRSMTFAGLDIDWETPTSDGRLLGTVRLSSGRVQPFALLLKSEGDHLIVRCVSPIGQVGPESGMEDIQESVHHRRVRIGAILGEDDRSYDLTVEDDVLLGAREHDEARVAALLEHVAQHADELEHVHLASDEPLETFESDLRREGGSRDA